MSKKVILKNAKFVETTFEDGSKQLVGLVRGDSFVNLDIPTDPNPRQFVGEANPNYTAMVKTLKSEPELFARKNAGGITIFATACDSNGDGSYTLTFKRGQGVANGSHSYFALKAHGRENSYVKVVVEIGVDKESVVDIAESLNSNKKLKAYSLQNSKGAFNWYKKAVANRTRKIVFHEGDAGAIEIKEDMAFLNLFKHNLETKELDILANLHRSESQTTALLNGIAKGDEFFESSLKFIAKDVHDLMMYITFNKKFAAHLEPLRAATGQNWFKNRPGGLGIMKGFGLLLMAGIAAEGSYLNKNNIVTWRTGFKSADERKAFVDQLFSKVFDVLVVEEGSSSEIVRKESVRKKAIRHAMLINKANKKQKREEKKSAEATA